MAYFLIVSISVIRTYVEIIQVWMFPTASTFMLTLFLCLVSYYIISSGFRVITGICVISVGGTLGYLFLSLFVLKYSHWDNLLPIFTHSFSDILKSAQLSIYSMTGFEIYLMVYPFVKSLCNLINTLSLEHYFQIFYIYLAPFLAFAFLVKTIVKNDMGPTFYDPSYSITIYRKTRIYCNFRLCTRYYFKFYPPFMGVNESNS